MVEDYLPGTVIKYEDRILMYVGTPLNTQTHRFKELMPRRFMPCIETVDAYEKIKREAEVLGILTRTQLIEIGHKHANLEELLIKFHIL